MRRPSGHASRRARRRHVAMAREQFAHRVHVQLVTALDRDDLALRATRPAARNRRSGRAPCGAPLRWASAAAHRAVGPEDERVVERPAAPARAATALRLRADSRTCARGAISAVDTCRGRPRRRDTACRPAARKSTVKRNAKGRRRARPRASGRRRGRTTGCAGMKRARLALAIDAGRGDRFARRPRRCRRTTGISAPSTAIVALSTPMPKSAESRCSTVETVCSPAPRTVARRVSTTYSAGAGNETRPLRRKHKAAAGRSPDVKSTRRRATRCADRRLRSRARRAASFACC